MQLKALTLTLMAASALVACSAPVAVPTLQDSSDTSVLTSQVDKNVLDRTFRDTWRSMAAMTAGQRLPSDNLCLSGGSEALSAYTSPTNIGAYLWSTLAARDHGVISASDAHARMAAILTTLSGMERHHGFFLNWYKPADATPVTIWPTDGNVVAPFLSTVDNAWLAVGLIMVKNADPGLKAQAGALLDSMNWGFFYDRSKGHLYGGYTVSGAQNTSPETKITLSSSGAALGDLQTASTLSLQVYVPAGTTLAPNSFFVGMADTTGGGFNWVDGTFAGQTLHPSWNTVNLGVPQAWKTLNPAQTYTLYFSFFNETAGVKTPLQSGFNLGAATLDTPAGPTAFSLWHSATAASFGNDHTGAVVTADAGVLTPGGQPSLQVAPVSAGQYTDFAYGALNTEPRIASYLGLARGQLPKEHYFKLYRTFPTDWEQEQTPTGVTRTYEGVNVYEGAYSYGGVKMVPSWGGSMFEALMVPEFVPETEWAPQSWGKNHDNYVKAQIYHGLNDARYGYWGFSPSNKPEGGYSEYGVDAIGIKADGYASNNDKTLWNPVTPPDAAAYTNGVVTPHASFLALQFEPNAAMKNLRNLEKDFDVYGKYGYFDSVNVQTKVVSSCVLALDQGMIMSALGNWFLGDHYRNYLADDLRPVVQPLIRQERFSIP